MLNVSVIIPCYRCESTIRRAVDSVMRQTVLPSEIILVDDFSNDEVTLNELYSIKALFKDLVSIIVIALSENGGAGVARNYGWQYARYDYIAFLDADDSWHKNKLEVQYDWMRSNPDALISCHKSEIQKENGFSADRAFRNIVPFFYNNLLFSNAIETRTVMLKSNLPIRFDENKRYAEDYLLWLEFTSTYKQPIYQANSCLAYTHSNIFLSSGLSSHLLKMEFGVQDAYKTMLKKRKIGLPMYMTVSLFSWLKFLRRLFLSKISK